MAFRQRCREDDMLRSAEAAFESALKGMRLTTTFLVRRAFSAEVRAFPAISSARLTAIIATIGSARRFRTFPALHDVPSSSRLGYSKAKRFWKTLILAVVLSLADGFGGTVRNNFTFRPTPIFGRQMGSSRPEGQSGGTASSVAARSSLATRLSGR